MRYLLTACLLFTLCTACHRDINELKPKVFYSPQKRHIQSLPRIFPPLNEEEIPTNWGRELVIADSFASDFDLYRAITSYKRAKTLLPLLKEERRWQINYSIMLCYYLGGKYTETIETFDESDLNKAPSDFPAFRNLLIILYDSYYKKGEIEKACRVWDFINEHDTETAKDLQLSTAITTGNIPAIRFLTQDRPSHHDWINEFCYCSKSPQTAQTLNALLPGSGYLYVGQKKTAFTSLVLNTLFIWATYRFFDQGHIAAGIFTLSLESGWYIGGINGGGLAARRYNEQLYNKLGKEAMLSHYLFPVLQFEYAF